MTTTENYPLARPKKTNSTLHLKNCEYLANNENSLVFEKQIKQTIIKSLSSKSFKFYKDQSFQSITAFEGTVKYASLAFLYENGRAYWSTVPGALAEKQKQKSFIYLSFTHNMLYCQLYKKGRPVYYKDLFYDNTEISAKEIHSLINMIKNVNSEEYSESEIFHLSKVLILKVFDFIKHHNKINEHNMVEDYYRVSTFLDMNPHYLPSVEEVSQLFNMSKARINAVYDSVRDCSFFEYSSIMRMEKIRKELTETTAKVLEISEKYNFTNYDYFIQMFKKLYNITPLQFRKLSNKTDLTQEEKFRLSHTNGFHNLKKIDNKENKVSKKFGENEKMYMIFFNNMSDRLIKSYWCRHDGELILFDTLKPGERRHLGIERGQYWVLQNEDGEERVYLCPPLKSTISWL